MQAPTQHPTETTPQAPKQRSRRVWAFAAAFIIVLVGVGAATLLLGGDDQPPVVDEPAPPTIVDTTEPLIQVESLVWTRVPHDEAAFGSTGEPVESDNCAFDARSPHHGCVHMIDVTTGGPGFVAVGSAGDDAVVWTSPDGIAWTRIQRARTATSLERMFAVTEGGPGFVAVGERASLDLYNQPDAWELEGRDPSGDLRARGPAVWTSVDGANWAAVPDEDTGFPDMSDWPAGLENVAGGDSRLIAIGAGPPGGNAVWTSSDGIAWSSFPPLDAYGFVLEGHEETDIPVRDVTTGGPGFVAVGANQVWTSSDGYGWTPVPHDDAVFEYWPAVDIYAVTQGGPGLVAVGIAYVDKDSDAYPVPAVWASTDGITWSRVLLEGGESRGYLEMNGVVAVGDGLIAVGEVDGAPAAWTSSDGVTWSRVPHDEAVFGQITPDQEGETEILSITAGPEGIVAVGHDGDDAAVWIATPEE